MRQVVQIGFLALCLVLGGCQDDVSVADIKGACDAFDAPVQPVIGKRRVDQRWIDRAIEAGVSACGWSRPRAVENVNRAIARR